MRVKMFYGSWAVEWKLSIGLCRSLWRKRYWIQTQACWKFSITGCWGMSALQKIHFFLQTLEKQVCSATFYKFSNKKMTHDFREKFLKHESTNYLLPIKPALSGFTRDYKHVNKQTVNGSLAFFSRLWVALRGLTRWMS